MFPGEDEKTQYVARQVPEWKQLVYDVVIFRKWAERIEMR